MLIEHYTGLFLANIVLHVPKYLCINLLTLKNCKLHQKSLTLAHHVFTYSSILSLLKKGKSEVEIESEEAGLK